MTTGARQVFSSKQVIFPHHGSMAPGATKQLVFQVKDADTNQRLADGTYQLSLLAWPSANSIPELSTTNNSKQDTIILPLPKPIDWRLVKPGPKPIIPAKPGIPGKPKTQ